MNKNLGKKLVGMEDYHREINMWLWLKLQMSMEDLEVLGAEYWLKGMRLADGSGLRNMYETFENLDSSCHELNLINYK